MKSCFLSTARVGLKGPTGTSFFHDFLKKLFFSQFYQYILIIEKWGKKSQPPDWPLFSPPGGQETIYHVRVAWEGESGNVKSHVAQGLPG